MSERVNQKKILLGVTGGIAAYKSCDLVRRLKETGREVRVVMTEAAKEFVSPMTFQALSGNPVHDALFDRQAEAAMGHIELSRWADVVVIAPASADFLARIAHGHCNDLLTTLCLTTRAPIALVPAMNVYMWENVATQENVEKLKSRGFRIWGPAKGSHACGDEGYGRMLEPLDILQQLEEQNTTQEFLGKKILITAGPTQEPIDSVRYLTNHSSGKMGYALAQAAKNLGADVILVSGPCALPQPSGVDFHGVVTAQEMYDTVMKYVDSCDIFIGAAAVADYRSASPQQSKMKKSKESLTLTLQPNVDIIASIGERKKKPFLVGFAAETDDVLLHARKKLQEKNLHMIIANEVGKEGVGFNSDTNAVTLCWKEGEKKLPKQLKTTLAYDILKSIAERYKAL